MLELGGMANEVDTMEVHPPGALEALGSDAACASNLDTYGGRYHVEWDSSAKVTAFGPLS